MICVYLCVCFRMHRPSQHSVCGAWHSSQGCVWSSLLFSDHYHCACFIGERVFGHLTPLQPPPPHFLRPVATTTMDCGLRLPPVIEEVLEPAGVCVCVMHLQVFICAMVHGNNYCFLSPYLHLHCYLVCHEAEGCLEGWDGLAVFVWCYIKTESCISVSQRKGYVCVLLKTDMCR